MTHSDKTSKSFMAISSEPTKEEIDDYAISQIILQNEIM